MSQKYLFIFLLLFLQSNCYSVYGQNEDARKYYIQVLAKIADPVLVNLSQNKLKKIMPIETPVNSYSDRDQVTHLEAFGRLLSGMAPWLELGPDESEEGRLREKYILMVHQGLKNATDPKAADFMNFSEGGQPVVDAAFLAQGLLRAPEQLWERLDSQTQSNIIKALKSTRTITPYYNNWLLFSAIVEAALLKFDGEGDRMRIAYAINKHKEWYLGDGMYGDGPDFHWDYYNSFVIQPMLIDISKVLVVNSKGSQEDFDLFLKSASRYAEIQERLISPEGTYPVIGRSMAYRFGAFQALSQIALLQELPEEISPAQVREALLAVIQKHMEADDMFDENGWLTLGFYGHQPELAEPYISTGSLYLCSEVFLVLGLPAEAPFWSAPPEEWTQQKVWSGKKSFIDKAL